MSTTLTNGLKLPDKGSVDWYADMQSNYAILDGAVGTVAEHTTQIAGKAPAVHTHTKSDITDFPAYGNAAGTICEGNDSRLSDARTPVAHTHTKSDVTDLLNSNFIPSANNSYDLGSSSYQWNNIYAKNYYYNGTAWGLDKVNEWSNTNYFNKTLFCDFSNLANKEIPNAYIQDPLIIVEGNTSPKTWHGGIALERYTNGDEGFQLLTCSYVNGTTQQLGAFRYLVSGDGTESYCYSRGPAKQHLGTSTNKWSTLNGVNPGALSLPNYSNAQGLDVSAQGLNWDLTGATVNTYTPTFDGYLSLRCKDTNGDFLFAAYGGNNVIIRNCAVGTGILPGNAGLCLLMPMQANTAISIQVKAATNFKAYVIPCFGNV